MVRCRMAQPPAHRCHPERSALPVFSTGWESRRGVKDLHVRRDDCCPGVSSAPQVDVEAATPRAPARLDPFPVAVEILRPGPR